MQNSPTPATIVPDASVAIWTLVPALAPVDCAEQMIAWRQAGAYVRAPALWLAECVSAIRRYVHAELITPQEGLTAVDDLIALEITVVHMTSQQCRSAYAWAERLGQSRAYDGFYIALADELDAAYVTGDRRLVNAARKLGLSWVQWIGDC